MKIQRPLTALVALAITALAGAASAQTVLKLGHITPASSHIGFGAQVFAEELAARTEGRYNVQIFPDSQLGGEREMIESLQLGTLDLAHTSTGPVINFVPEMGILDIPFLFRDNAHAHAVLDSKIGQDLLDKFSSRGLVALGWGDQSFRHVMNNRRPVSGLEDMKGLKIRTMENPVHIKAFNTIGALATPMAWPETIPALQQGTVDGVEMAIPPMASMNLGQLQKHMTMTGHVYGPMIFLMAPRVWNKLDSEDQTAFVDAARAAGTAQREYMAENDRKGLEELKLAGVEVVETVDKSIFQDALLPAYKEFAKTYGQENIDNIINFQ